MSNRPDSSTITFRVSSAKRARYEQAAAARGLSLSAYVAHVLDGQDAEQAQAPGIDELRQLIAEARPQQAASGGNEVDRGLLLEAVLRLRRGATPQDSDRIYAEVQRNGLPAWKGKDPRNAS